MYGYLNSFQVFLEAAGMFCAPWLVNRIGAKNGLIFAGMVMACVWWPPGWWKGRC
jgi:OHS family lactose permease-like MFS transporter